MYKLSRAVLCAARINAEPYCRAVPTVPRPPYRAVTLGKLSLLPACQMHQYLGHWPLN